MEASTSKADPTLENLPGTSNDARACSVGRKAYIAKSPDDGREGRRSKSTKSPEWVRQFEHFVVRGEHGD